MVNTVKNSLISEKYFEFTSIVWFLKYIFDAPAAKRFFFLRGVFTSIFKVQPKNIKLQTKTTNVQEKQENNFKTKLFQWNIHGAPAAQKIKKNICSGVGGGDRCSRPVSNC